MLARTLVTMAFTITSPAFQDKGPIPALYTSDGEDISPPLEWKGVPAGTKSLALIVDDPDAPDPKAPKMTWVHWVLYNIPSTSTGLEQAVADASLPTGTLQAKSDFKRYSYGGPSPPIGTHRYFHKLYALDTVLPDLGPDATKPTLLEAMQGHVVGETVLMGTYLAAKNSQ